MTSPKTIKEAIYNLCIEANTLLNDTCFEKLLNAYKNEKVSDAKQALQLILKNAKMANDKKMPLCQDTGQVLVFAKVGNRACFTEDFASAINEGIAEAYEKNFYRKSVVKNALFDRSNTKTNTPCIIYTELVDSDEIEFEVLIKGAGSENMSVTQMLSPTASEDEIVDFVVSVVKTASAKACPPYFIGLGIGGTMEYAGLLSKKALLLAENIDENHKNLVVRIKNEINKLNIGAAGLGGAATALDIKILTNFTHIACMPAAVTINCHSSRHAKCKIKGDEITYYPQKLVANYTPDNEDFSDFAKIHTSEIDKLKSLKKGQNVLLSGEIYTARDMAHKRLIEMLSNGEALPFDLKNKVILYAGPCPCSNDCVVGSIGPTTSSRMDKYATTLYKNGVLATIGKGERSSEIEKTVKEVGGLYFTVIGGIACYLSERFIKKDLVAFEDLGTEAIFRFEVKDLPLRLDIC